MTPFDEYTAAEHRFRFAAWAAARASARGVAGFNARKAFEALDFAGLGELANTPQALPQCEKEFDRMHTKWCGKVIGFFQHETPQITYGRAAKLVNVFLKALYLNYFGGEEHASPAARPNANVIHPPVDRLVLSELARLEHAAPNESFWPDMLDKGWTNFNQSDYEKVITEMRRLSKNRLWRIESCWRGYQ